MRRTSMGMRAFAAGLSMLLALSGAPVAAIAEEAEPQVVEQAAMESTSVQAGDEQATTDEALPEATTPTEGGAVEEAVPSAGDATTADSATDDAVEVTTDGSDEVEVTVDGEPTTGEQAADQGAALQTQSDDAALQTQGGASISYRTHVQKKGWQGWRKNGKTAGTSGKRLRLEGIKIKLSGVSGGVTYRTHVQKIGWQGWKSNGQMAGTKGKALRLEAINIQLTGQAAELYDVYYRVHAQKFGWLDWAKNGYPAGTQGYGYRLEAIQIRLVPKGQAAPGATANPFVLKRDNTTLYGEGFKIAMPSAWRGKVTVTGYGVMANDTSKQYGVLNANTWGAEQGSSTLRNDRKYALATAKLKSGQTVYIAAGEFGDVGFVAKLSDGRYAIIQTPNFMFRRQQTQMYALDDIYTLGYLQTYGKFTYGSGKDQAVAVECLKVIAKNMTVY